MKTTTDSTDRIEKQVLLRAPRARVWRALTDVRQFNEWFGVELTGSFEPGARLRGPVKHRGYEHLTMEITIEQVQPERLLSWRWHPGADEPGVERGGGETTLVVFELEEVEGGTLAKVVETGFDRVPVARRARVYRENEEGWAAQMAAIEGYVGGAA